MKTLIIVSIISILSTFIFLNAQSYTFDFSIDDRQFVGGVSDFGVDQSQQHQFTFDNRPLPSPLNTQQNAQYLSGINPSDDLFMFMKRKITGLQPNTIYEVTFNVEFASIYPTNAIGVGGPPGEGVTMKAGLTQIEPDTMIINKGGSYVSMNIDKGNQSIPGMDMDTIGHVGVSDTTTVYTLKTNDNIEHPFVFTSDPSGEGWFILGTDSGFEAQTSLYFTTITVEFSEITSVEDGIERDDIIIYPNPSPGEIFISSKDGDVERIQIFDTAGRSVLSNTINSGTISFHLPKSEYVFRITTRNSIVVKRVIVL